MKKILSILLVMVILLTGLAGCGGGKAKGEGPIVSLPAADVQRTAMEQAGAMAHGCSCWPILKPTRCWNTISTRAAWRN